MKTIGLIGGMSWESTTTYYQIVNRVVQEKLGGFHSAKCVLWNVDFQEIEECMSSGRWERAGEILADAARALERAGAEFFLICTNTLHKVAEQVQAAVSIPLMHIAQVTADSLLEQGVRRAGLLGTRYTMEQDFYKKNLADRGLEVFIPEAAARARLNDIIFDELCLGVVRDDSKAFVLGMVDDLAKAGAEGMILGCTEIGMLLQQDDSRYPLFDTTLIHARSAVLHALGLAGKTP